MRSQDALEIARATLALALPLATDESLTRMAEAVIRWGAEDVEPHLTEELVSRMFADLLALADTGADSYTLAEDAWENRLAPPAEYRTWSRSEGMEPLAFASRPVEEPTRPPRPSERDQSHPDRGNTPPDQPPPARGA